MAVETDTIIRKMMKELTQAQQISDDNGAVQKHIANVQLLCELIMEERPKTDSREISMEEKPKTDSSEISTEEMKAMIGESNTNRKQNITRHSQEEDDDANGSSLFDF